LSARVRLGLDSDQVDGISELPNGSGWWACIAGRLLRSLSPVFVSEALEVGSYVVLVRFRK